MTSSTALTVLTNAPDDQEAQLIVALLRAHGIPAFVEGSLLMDEWAVAQRVMGQIGIEVKVPANAVERATKLLEEARVRGAMFEEQEAIEGPLEVDPEPDDTPTEAEIAEFAQKPAYNFLVLFLAVMGAGIIIWILLYFFLELEL